MTEAEERLYEEALKQVRIAGDRVREVEHLMDFGRDARELNFKKRVEHKMKLMAERFNRFQVNQTEGESG